MILDANLQPRQIRLLEVDNRGEIVPQGDFYKIFNNCG